MHQPSSILGSLLNGFVRQNQLVRDPKHPNRQPLLPFSGATLWRKVSKGSFPSPVKLSERITAWRVQDVLAWINEHAAK